MRPAPCVCVCDFCVGQKAKKKKKKKKVVKEESSDEEEEEEEEEDSDSSSSLEDHKEAGGYDGDMEDVSQQGEHRPLPDAVGVKCRLSSSLKVAGNNVHNSVSPDADAAATEEGTVQQNSKVCSPYPVLLVSPMCCIKSCCVHRMQMVPPVPSI